MATSKPFEARIAGCLLWIIAVVAMIVARDIVAPASTHTTDFVSSFYVAGTMVVRGLAEHLYSWNGDTFIGSYFDRFTHQLLPDVPPTLLGVYAYSPLASLLFAPLSLLLPQYALLLWQLVSVAALVISAKITERLYGKSTLLWLFCAFTFMPVFATIWIGQVGILFGLLPLWCAYFLLTKEKQVASGAVLSLILLKPQFLPIAVFAMVGFAIAGRWRTAMGFAAGAVVLLIAFVLSLGPHVFMDWLHVMKMYGHVLSGNDIVSPRYLIIGLPGALLAALPPEQRESFRFIDFGLAGAVALATLAFIAWIAKGKQSVADKQSASLIVSIMALPVFSPHLMFYDLCLYLVPAVMIWNDSNESFRGLRRWILAMWLAINVYIVVAVVARNAVPPLVLPLSLVLFQIPILRALYRNARHSLSSNA